MKIFLNKNNNDNLTESKKCKSNGNMSRKRFHLKESFKGHRKTDAQDFIFVLFFVVV